MAPWASASTLPAWLRALLLALTGWTAASIAAFGVLRRATRTRLGALVLGASGPLVGLGLLRLLERADASPRAFVLVPFAAGAACLALSALFLRLRWPWRAASTSSEVTGMGNIGVTEILLIALVALLLFGAGRIADIGKGLGQGIKNFKQGLKEAEELDGDKKPDVPKDDKPADAKT